MPDPCPVRKRDEVYAVTGAQAGTKDQQERRIGKYLVSMGIRVVCLIAAVLVPGWPRWLFVAGAVLLPYVAVVIANAGRERTSRRSIIVESPQRELPSTPSNPGS